MSRSGIALVVEVVDEAGDGVELLVLVPLAGVGAHGRLDRRAGAFAASRSRSTRRQAPMHRLLRPPPSAGYPRRPWRNSSSRAAFRSRERSSPAGNKNAALPILAACLLTEEELVVRNVPRIRDVESMLGLLERLGVKVEWTGDNEVRLQADASRRDRRSTRSSPAAIRASFLVAGPLLARFGEAKMPPPGRRHDRPPPPRRPPRRLPRPRREGRTATSGSSSRPRRTA